MNPFFETPNPNPLRCHVFSLDNIPSSLYYSVSPFAQRIRNLCWLLKSTGHEIIYYGYDSCEVECDEKIVVMQEEIMNEAYPDIHAERGHVNINKERKNPEGVKYLENLWTLNTEYELKKRYKPGDFFFWMLPGAGQRHLYYKTADLPVNHIEAGIGYIGACLPFRIFISHYIRDFHHGIYQSNKYHFGNLSDAEQEQVTRRPHYLYTREDCESPPKFDVVIPRSFDISLFDFRTEKEDNLLYLARVLRGKGIKNAVEIAEKVDMKLVVAGPNEDDFEEAVGSPPSDNVELLGPIGPERRKDELSKAKAVLSLTHIHETFGGAAVEAMISGTVPIVANSGGFLDTVKNGYNGYRVDPHDVDAGVQAVKSVDDIDPYNLRESGLHLSRERVALMYDQYLQYLSSNGKVSKPSYQRCWESEKNEWPEGWMIPVGNNDKSNVEDKENDQSI